MHGMLEVAQEGMELLVVLVVGGRVDTQPFVTQVRPRGQHTPPRELGHWKEEAASQGRGQQAARTVVLGSGAEVMVDGAVEEPEEARRVVAAVMVEVVWQ